jgi:hypothetical protein
LVKSLKPSIIQDTKILRQNINPILKNSKEWWAEIIE